MSLKNRLALLFFLITAGAILIVYAYVVPNLRSSLVEQKQKTLASLSSVYAQPLRKVMSENLSSSELDRLVRRLGQRAGARLTLLGIAGVPRARSTPATAQINVIADSQSLQSAVTGSYKGAQRAWLTGRVRESTESVGGQKLAQIARPLRFVGNTPWIAVFSSGLRDVDESVSSIRKQILIAGAIALLLALIVGYLVARAIALRAKRLEQAAREVAAGQFTNPIPVDTEDELGKLAHTFNDMQSRLRRLDSARKEFIANASHELRTPLFSLAGSVELLQEEDLSPHAREEFLQTIKEQVDRLTKLATDLLDLSMIDAGSLTLQEEHVDLVELSREVAREFRPVAAQHDSQIEVEHAGDRSAEAVCDSGRLAQIVRILLDNALTHTPEGTPINVVAYQRNGTAELTVYDSGPGLTSEQQEQIFDRFFSGSAGKGTGLGLAIAKELAERMRGQLSVESKPGHTAFKLILPTESEYARTDS